MFRHRTAFRRALRWVPTVLIAILSLPPVSLASAATIPPIRHIFIIVLENEGAKFTFGPKSPAPYLSRTLVRQGAYLHRYYGIGHASLDNYIAMISGQSVNYETQGDCQTFSDFVGVVNSADGQAVGHGCVYPASVLTLADQLARAGFSWKSYSEDMGNDPSRERPVCGHPEIGKPDLTQRAQPQSALHPLDQYAARHNPFVYFHSIIDSADCETHVVNMQSLSTDLRSSAVTPNFVFITPNLCNDGHDGGRPGKSCVDGAPGGLKSADQFLERWVPQIIASPAFKKDGLLIVTFDEADIEGRYNPTTQSYVLSTGDASSCCNEPKGPNVSPDQVVFGSRNEGPGIFGPGGGRIGAILVSPFIRPRTTSHVAYNHYSLLKTIEKIFGLTQLGFAAQPGLRAFGPDIFNKVQGAEIAQ